MYIDTSHITRGGKTYTRHLLRESYRANGKVLHRTLANVSHCSAAEIEALRLALRHKEDLEHLGTVQDAVTLKQGLSFGAVWTVYHVARRLGIAQALGTTREGKLALWQVMARVIEQGSRLSAVRLAMAHGIRCRPTLGDSTGTGHDPRRETGAVASHGPRDRARLAPLGRASGDGAWYT